MRLRFTLRDFFWLTVVVALAVSRDRRRKRPPVHKYLPTNCRPFDQKSNSFLIAYTVVARPARAMERVSGMFLGQTATQFWALPHTCMPPSVDQRVEPLAGVHFAGGVHVEQHRLADGRGADEAAVVGRSLAGCELRFRFAVVPLQFDLRVLRAGFQAAAAGHALAQRIRLLLHFRRNQRAGPWS